ncbi:MAG: 50S ribosomal protein L22 [Candidatus Woesebacteria bacterium GW2011_GWC2_47_16]|uniref:Large ribosomal subunit protein uL22 n=8 Tax=Candidatus Woeseibacteriota TaxID=1752722 RepID=A0A0G1VL99_9BACT|nr:MAG: 50S ribosomal protein L22 [Candidatus Woesebacteria bacterium GW2011_GWE1_45_18]KKU23838.1 MAG: 50S ribosomal protein L22 [Candidatus Woesebacteria bacterium GW2011_GWF1_46_13]KKU64477.1 MAG: 50S ribosomal protein L22 [Candidatus Woesebacteria bacterium GW2011_GWC2_47_16]KKU70825.1 MAG: 50S ribosomal protein L22 [Candidatus Woesebacteria bacterium GW2011_GWD1_47_21]OGM78779.1 MAG: 50S ribosomal protein L22 [Candidatus Woesebacteria bacterium RIFOXYA1_FULL_48_16]OGM82202.1 MAG: 50S ribo
MEFIATQKFLLVSPKKVRPIIDVARVLTPAKAIEVLPFTGKRAAEPIVKVIKTAIANAVQKGISADDLKFKEIRVSEGPRLKRGRPVSRGRWHPFKRRMSHIRVVLETVDKVPVAKKEETKAEAVKKGVKRGTKN